MEAFEVFSPALAIGKALFGAKPKAKPTAAPLVASRNVAAEQAATRDRVSKRRGVAANLILGAGGAESSTGTKTQLGT